MVSLHDLLNKPLGGGGSNKYYTKQTNSFCLPNDLRERGGLVGEPQTPKREVGSSITTSAVLSKDKFIPKSTGNTQEAVAPSRRDLEIVYWGVKP